MTAPMLPSAPAAGPLAPRRRPVGGGQALQQGQYAGPGAPPGATSAPTPTPGVAPGPAAPGGAQRAQPRPPPTGAYAQNPYRQAAAPAAAPANPYAAAAPAGASASPYAAYASPATAPSAAPSYSPVGAAPTGSVDNALQSTVLQALAQPSAYGSTDVQRSYNQLAGSIDDQYTQQNQAIRDEMARRGLGVSTEADYRLQASNAAQKSAHTQLADSLLTQQAQQLGQDRATAAQLGTAYQGQQQQYGLGQQAQALAAELGRGNLGVAQQQAGTQATSVANQYALGQGQLGLDTQKLGEDARQFNAGNALQTALGYGGLNLQQAGLQNQNAQFYSNLAQQANQFGATDFRQAQSLGLQNSAQQTALMQSAAGILGQIAATPGLSSILTPDPKTGQLSETGQRLMSLVGGLTSGLGSGGMGAGGPTNAGANPFIPNVNYTSGYNSPFGTPGMNPAPVGGGTSGGGFDWRTGLPAGALGGAAGGYPGGSPGGYPTGTGTSPYGIGGLGAAGGYVGGYGTGLGGGLSPSGAPTTNGMPGMPGSATGTPGAPSTLPSAPSWLAQLQQLTQTAHGLAGYGQATGATAPSEIAAQGGPAQNPGAYTPDEIAQMQAGRSALGLPPLTVSADGHITESDPLAYAQWQAQHFAMPSGTPGAKVLQANGGLDPAIITAGAQGGATTTPTAADWAAYLKRLTGAA